MFEFDVRFHTKVGKSNLSCFTDCTKHASAVALIHGQQRVYWVFTQTKLSSIYRHKLYSHLLGLDKASSVAYKSGEIQTCNYNYYYFFYSSLYSLFFTLAKSSQACDKRRETLKSWNGAISKYILLVFFGCFGKAVNLQHM